MLMAIALSEAIGSSGRCFAVERSNYVVFAGQRQQHTQAVGLPGDGPASRGETSCALSGLHAKASAQGKPLYRFSRRGSEAVRAPIPPVSAWLAWLNGRCREVGSRIASPRARRSASAHSRVRVRQGQKEVVRQPGGIGSVAPWQIDHDHDFFVVEGADAGKPSWLLRCRTVPVLPAISMPGTAALWAIP